MIARMPAFVSYFLTYTAERCVVHGWLMPTQLDEPPESDDIDRELEKLRGFGSTLFLALGASAVLIAVITVILWWLLL